MCGKDSGITGGSKMAKGSPPRVRERREITSCVFPDSRITPACAGKTDKAVMMDV